MDLGLKGKTAFVAASTEGLGYATAKALVLEGAKVWIGSRTEEKVRSASEALNREASAAGSPGRADGTVLDMVDVASIASWTATGIGTFGPEVDALVANAGGPPPGKFVDFDDQAWQAAFEVLVLSPVRLIRACLSALRPESAILLVSSTSVKEPIDNLILSNSLRAAAVTMAKTLSTELAPRGIRINCLAPGRFSTGRIERIDAATADRMGISPEVARVRAEASIPMGRYGDTDEFGRTACWLLSPAASYITGQLVSADGGMTKGTW